MKKVYKILAISSCTAICIAIPVTVVILTNESLKCKFNISDIIDECVGEDNTMSYFKKHYPGQIQKMDSRDASEWQNDKENKCMSLVDNMSKKQLSVDIAFAMANWWKAYWDSKAVEPIDFLSSYVWDPDSDINWRKDWSFTVDVRKKEVINGSLVCSFNMKFNCDSWRKELEWAKKQDPSKDDYSKVRLGGSASFKNVIIDFQSDPTDYHYHINTRDLDLEKDTNGQRGCMEVMENMLATNIWSDIGYAHFGGTESGGDGAAFYMNSFILNKYIL